MEGEYQRLEFPFNLYAMLLSKYGKVKYLHYGYWEDDADIPINIAQENLSNKLLEIIPENVSDVLDVGCGLGTTVCELLSKKYNPVGISPDKNLIEYAKRNYPQCKDRFILTAFENYNPDEPFDLLLFCESAQYIKDLEGLF